MTATDGDKDRPQNIVYFLTGQGIDADNPSNSKFDINRTTGEIFVLRVSGSLLALKDLVPKLRPDEVLTFNFVGVWITGCADEVSHAFSVCPART